jgi:hypothetical protein
LRESPATTEIRARTYNPSVNRAVVRPGEPMGSME